MKLSKFGKAFFDSLYNVCCHMVEKKEHYRTTLLANGGLDLKGQKMTEASSSACKLLHSYMEQFLERPVILRDQEWVTRRFEALILGIVECARNPMINEPNSLMQYFFNGEGFLTFALDNGIFKTGKYGIVVVPDTKDPSSDISATKAEVATEGSPEAACLSLDAALRKMHAETDFSRQVPTEEGACIDLATRTLRDPDTANNAPKDKDLCEDSKPPRIPLIETPDNLFDGWKGDKPYSLSVKETGPDESTGQYRIVIDIPVAKTPEAESESASRDPDHELSYEEAKLNDQYPHVPLLATHQVVLRDVVKSLLELAPFDYTYEDMLCRIMGSISRSISSHQSYFGLREVFDQAKYYLSSVGRTINFKHPDPRCWITLRDGVSGRWD